MILGGSRENTFLVSGFILGRACDATTELRRNRRWKLIFIFPFTYNQVKKAALATVKRFCHFLAFLAFYDFLIFLSREVVIKPTLYNFKRPFVNSALKKARKLAICFFL